MKCKLLLIKYIIIKFLALQECCMLSEDRAKFEVDFKMKAQQETLRAVNQVKVRRIDDRRGP